MLLSVAFLYSKCILRFRLPHDKHYQRSVKVLNIKHFSNFLRKESRRSVGSLGNQ